MTSLFLFIIPILQFILFFKESIRPLGEFITYEYPKVSFCIILKRLPINENINSIFNRVLAEIKK